MSNSYEERGWWARNWYWVVPLGCLAPVIVCAGIGAGVFSLVFGALKGSDVYKQAVDLARNHPAVQAALGTPISEGALPSGTLNTINDGGNADIHIPLSGPKGAGSLHAVATRAGGNWTMSSLVLDVAGTDKHIDLLVKR